MKSVRKFLMVGAISSLSAFAAFAGGSGHDHHAAAPATKATKAAKAEMSEGEVRKVDKEGKKVTIKHGPLKNLDMPPMTMAFQVTDPAMLNKVKVGDKVRFVAAKTDGRYTVTEIQPAP